MAYPTNLYLIGGNGGSPFVLTGMRNGASLEKIWVWVGGWQIKAVKIWLSDGRVEAFGKEYGNHQEYKFSPGECFTSLSLWGNGAGTRLGGIKFTTNKNGYFFAHMTSWGLKTEYPMDVGSGYCLGVIGRSGVDIDCMGFLFLEAVDTAVLTNVHYPTIKQRTPEVALEEIKSITYKNNTSTKLHQKIETSKKLIKQSSWSMTNSFTKVFGVQVKAGIPGIVEVSGEFTFKIGTESSYRQQQTEESNESLTTTVEVPPQKKIDVDISIGRANFDLPYTGTMMITCKNGSVLEFETKGQYKGITYTDVKVYTVESNL